MAGVNLVGMACVVVGIAAISREASWSAVQPPALRVASRVVVGPQPEDEVDGD